jgi:hypothetical protein
MAFIPIQYKVDFDKFAGDMLEMAWSRMLSQHYDKCNLKQFVGAFVLEAQELYDALIALQEGRTAYAAEGVNLDALGRIVGEPRKPFDYDDDIWFAFDRAQQGFDSAPFWCVNAPIGGYNLVGDEQYRLNVITRAIRNHTLTSSVPEVLDIVKILFNINVSYEKTGPNEVRILVPNTINRTALWYLASNQDTRECDDVYIAQYPVTLNISEIIYMPPEMFIFDREDRGFDKAPMGIGTQLQI